MLKKYRLSLGWKRALSRFGIDAVTVAESVGIPGFVFLRANSFLSADEYFRFWNAVVKHYEGKDFPLKLGKAGIEDAVNLAVVACLFQADLKAVVQFLQRFSGLIIPIDIQFEENDQSFTIIYGTRVDNVNVPLSLLQSQIVLMLHLLRSTTCRDIKPVSLFWPAQEQISSDVQNYLGCPVEQGDRCSVTFRMADATMPFLSYNQNMVEFLTPLLETRLLLLDKPCRFFGMVKSVLYDQLPVGGVVTLESVAAELLVTPRTLQRRLKQEGTCFRKVLDLTRSEMAIYYLKHTDLSGHDISYRLGFEDENSFYRAFQRWTGSTANSVRASIRF